MYTNFYWYTYNLTILYFYCLNFSASRTVRSIILVTISLGITVVLTCSNMKMSGKLDNYFQQKVSHGKFHATIQ